MVRKKENIFFNPIPLSSHKFLLLFSILQSFLVYLICPLPSLLLYNLKYADTHLFILLLLSRVCFSSFLLLCLLLTSPSLDLYDPVNLLLLYQNPTYSNPSLLSNPPVQPPGVPFLSSYLFLTPVASQYPSLPPVHPGPVTTTTNPTSLFPPLHPLTTNN